MYVNITDNRVVHVWKKWCFARQAGAADGHTSVARLAFRGNIFPTIQIESPINSTIKTNGLWMK